MNIFTKHPAKINETYFQHLRFAMYCGIQMIIAGMACIIHAIFPFCCKTNASDFIIKMVDVIKKRNKAKKIK